MSNAEQPETPQTDDQDEQEETTEERLDRLEAKLQSEKAVREATIKPRIESLQDALDEANTEREALRSELDATRETISELRAELEAIAGLADDQATNPEKRASDLRHILIRRAKANDGTIARMYWKEIQKSFADLGHGEIARPMCYDAIDELAEQGGFEETTKTSPHGNRVKAIRVDLDELRTNATCNDPTTQDTGSADQKPAKEVSN